VTSGPKNDRAERWPEAAATSTGIVLKAKIPHLAGSPDSGWQTPALTISATLISFVCE
jgi:hypothetical protein